MGIDLSKIKNNLEGREASKDIFKPQDGKNIVRLLPLRSTSKWDLPWIWNVFHYNLPTSEETRTPVLCGKTYKETNKGLIGEGHCPICELVSQLYKNDTEESKEFARRIKAQPLYYSYVLNRTEKNVPFIALKPLIYRYSKTVKEGFEEAFRGLFNKKTRKIVSSAELVDLEPEDVVTGSLDITDYNKGFNLLLEKQPKSKNTKFVTYTVVRSASPSKVEKPERFNEMMRDLESLIETPDMAVLKRNAELLNFTSRNTEEFSKPEEDDANDFPFTSDEATAVKIDTDLDIDMDTEATPKEDDNFGSMLDSDDDDLSMLKVDMDDDEDETPVTKQKPLRSFGKK